MSEDEKLAKGKPNFLNVTHCKKLAKRLYPDGRVSSDLLMTINGFVMQKIERASNCAKKYRHKTIRSEHLVR